MPKPATKKSLIDLGDVARRFFEEEGLDESGELRVWDEEPVDVETFVTHPAYLNLGRSVRPNVLKDLKNLFGSDPYRVAPVYNYAIFSEAVGTGKTWRMACAALYMCYKLLCLRDPIEYFNSLDTPGQPSLSPESKIAVILMAVTKENAKKIIYNEVGNKIINSPWFMENYPPNPRVISERQFDPLPEDFSKREPRVYKNVYIIPGSSSEYAAVGYSIIMAVIDEATLFEDTKDASLVGGADKNDQAEAVFHTLDNRIESRFLHQGLLVIAGNPKHERDFLERHAEDAMEDEDTYIVTRFPRWKSTMPNFDPEMDDYFLFHLDTLQIVGEELKDNERVITVPAVFKHKFLKSPEIAKRDIAGYPSSAIGRVIHSPMMVFDNVNEERENPLQVPDWVLQPSPPKKYLSPNFKRVHNVWHGAHFDIGEKRDAAGLCVAHSYGLDEMENPLIYTDLFVTFQGTTETPVDFDILMEWIIYLHEELGFQFGKITADQYQSSYLLQRLDKYKGSGFETGILSIDRSTDPYDELIQTIRLGNNDYYRHPVAINELTNLERHGNKYDHPRRGGKDLSDSWAGAVYNAIRLVDYPPPTDLLEDETKGNRAYMI